MKTATQTRKSAKATSKITSRKSAKLAPATPPVAVKVKKSDPKPCWCGCGGRTKSKFVQGHDSRFHSTIKKVLRGELDANAEYEKLPHNEARAEWDRFVENQLPKEEARDAKLAAKAADKATPKK